MLWKLAAAAVAGGFVVWQWVTNQPNKRAPIPAGPPLSPQARVLAGVASPAGVAAMQARMQECGATAEDLLLANNWTKRFAGEALPLRDRMVLIQQSMPVQNWPLQVQRVWCAFR